MRDQLDYGSYWGKMTVHTVKSDGYRQQRPLHYEYNGWGMIRYNSAMVGLRVSYNACKETGRRRQAQRDPVPVLLK